MRSLAAIVAIYATSLPPSQPPQGPLPPVADSQPFRVLEQRIGAVGWP